MQQKRRNHCRTRETHAHSCLLGRSKRRSRSLIVSLGDGAKVEGGGGGKKVRCGKELGVAVKAV